MLLRFFDFLKCQDNNQSWVKSVPASEKKMKNCIQLPLSMFKMTGITAAAQPKFPAVNIFSGGR